MGRGEINFVARLQDALSPPSPVSQLVLLLFFLLERGLGQAACQGCSLENYSGCTMLTLECALPPK